MENGHIGIAVNLSACVLRETPVELWGNESWSEMNAVATCPLDVRTAEILRIEYKPLQRPRSRLPAPLGTCCPDGSAGARVDYAPGSRPPRGPPGGRGGRRAAHLLPN